MASLGRSIATVGGNTFLSRILGFIRDLVIGHAFGADAATDAFFVAFRIPNFMRRLFAEGAFSMAFVPVLSEYKEQRPQEVKRFIDDVAGTLGAVLALVTLVGILAAPWIVLLFAPGFAAKGGNQALAGDMLRITFPYLMLISLTAFAGGILNTWQKFGVPAFTPVFLNLTMIAAALWLAPLMDPPIIALAWGVLVAGIIQLAFQAPFLTRLGLLPRPRHAPQDPGVQRILGLMVPALFGVSISQINSLVDTALASFLTPGSISWLYYSDRLMEFPVGVLGVALGTVILPNLSKRHAQADGAAFSQTLDWALRWVLLFGLPAAVGLGLLAGPLLATTLYSKSFDAHDVTMATQSLWAFSVGLMAFLAIKVLAPGYFARQDTRTPVRIGVIAVVANILFAVTLVFPLAHAGLALANSLSAAINAGLLYQGLRKTGILTLGKDWPGLLARALFANLVMGALLFQGTWGIEAWLQVGHWQRIGQLSLWILAGISVYFATLFITGIRPRHFLRAHVGSNP